jgi:hypothetical protein
MSAVPQECRTGMMSGMQLIDRVQGVLPGGSFICMALHCAFMHGAPVPHSHGNVALLELGRQDACIRVLGYLYPKTLIQYAKHIQTSIEAGKSLEQIAWQRNFFYRELHKYRLVSVPQVYTRTSGSG